MKTAVEWLIEELWQAKKTKSNWKEIEDQAKAMEKKQIIEAIKLTIEKEYYEQTWANCRSRSHMAEQYYNEIFKSE